MSPIPKAGLYYPSKFGLIMIKALEDVMGKNGLNAILNLAGLNNYIDNYPADNLEKSFDFADVSSINIALEEMYGPRGGRGLALRAGRSTFADALKNFGALAGARSWQGLVASGRGGPARHARRRRPLHGLLGSTSRDGRGPRAPPWRTLPVRGFVELAPPAWGGPLGSWSRLGAN